MKIAFIILANLLLISPRSFSQIWDWTKPEPNGIHEASLPESDDAHDIEVDKNGNVYVLGDFTDSLYLDNQLVTTGYGSYLAKYDSSGNMLWYNLIVPTYTPDFYYYSAIRATDLVVNSKGVFITGKFRPSQYVSYNCTTNTGSLIERSYRIGSLDFISSSSDNGYFLTKFNSNGNIAWNKFATINICYNNSWYSPGQISYNPLITTDNEDNIITAFLYARNLPSISIGNDVIPLSGSNAVNSYHLIVVKYGASGNLKWSTFAGGGFNNNCGGGFGFVQDCNSMIADNSGNIYFYGTAMDSTFFGTHLFETKFFEQLPCSKGRATFIAKLSSGGSWKYVKEFSNNSVNFLEGGIGNPDYLSVDEQNNVYALVNGSTSPLIIYGDTVYVAPNGLNKYLVKLNNSGGLVFYKGLTNDNGSYLNAISYYNNSLYITGGIRNGYNIEFNFGSLFVPPASLPNYGSVEYFVTKVNTNGEFIWATTFSGSDFNTSLEEGFGIRITNGNIFTSGFYRVDIGTLGNLNGGFKNPNPYIHQSFLGRLKDQYIKVGALSPLSICPGGSINIPFTSYDLSFSVGNTITAEISDKNGNFTSPYILGSITSTGSGTINGIVPGSLAEGSGYVVRIKSSDTLKTGYSYYAYADTPYKLTAVICPAPSSGFSTTNISATSAIVNWSTLDCAKGYKVRYKLKSENGWTTIKLNSNIGSLGLSGLLPDQTYQWKVATKCKPQTTVIYSDYSKNQEFTTGTLRMLSEGIKSNEDYSNSVFIYPNPTPGESVIVFNSDKSGNYTLNIIDVTGKILDSKKGIMSVGDNKVWIDVSKLSTGLYYIRLTLDQIGSSIIKLNKE